MHIITYSYTKQKYLQDGTLDKGQLYKINKHVLEGTKTNHQQAEAPTTKEGTH